MDHLETVKYAPNDIRIPEGQKGRKGIDVFCSKYGVKKNVGLGALIMAGLENEEQAAEHAERIEKDLE